MKQVSILLFIVLMAIASVTSQAQNTFPATGNVGIGTTTPSTLLQVTGGTSRFGSRANYMNIDTGGTLTFAGTAAYKVGGNKYAFQYTGNTNYGLFFNSSAVQYEFRNGSAVPVFSVNANTGNSIFNGTLKVGAYTLPSTDGTSGQVLTTNGTGGVNWSTISSGGGSQWTTSGTDIYYNTGFVGIGTSAPTSKLTIKSAGVGYYLQATNGTIDVRTYHGSGFAQMGTYSNHPFQLMANNGTDQFVLMPNGYVGIGNGNPTIGGLIVDAKAGATNAIFGSNTTGIAIESGYPYIGFNTYYNAGNKFISNGYAAFTGLDPTTGLFTIGNTSTSGTIGAAATLNTNIAITALGNVGIGTTIPAGKLDVAGDAYINGVGVGKGNDNGTAYGNTVLGASTLQSNTSGIANSAIGSSALYNNITGSFNTATGYVSLNNNKTGSSNTASGHSALYKNTSGSFNTGTGSYALYSDTSGTYNTASGYASLYLNTKGANNSAFGANALYNNTTGYSNVAIGKDALYKNLTGHNLVAIGDSALYNQGNISLPDYPNIAIGSKALFSNTTGYGNTANGYEALQKCNGFYNTAVGLLALGNSNTGNSNTAVGVFADVASGSEGSMALGFAAFANSSYQVSVGNTFVQVIGGQVGWST